MNLLRYIVHLAVILVHKNSPIHGQPHHALVRIHKNRPFHGERTSNATPIHKTGPLYGQDRHKANRVALGRSCGVCFEVLACVFASAGACMLVSIVVAAKSW